MYRSPRVFAKFCPNCLDPRATLRVVVPGESEGRLVLACAHYPAEHPTAFLAPPTSDAARQGWVDEVRHYELDCRVYATSTWKPEERAAGLPERYASSAVVLASFLKAHSGGLRPTFEPQPRVAA